MSNQVRTDVMITAKPKGFEAATAAAARLTKAAATAIQAQTRGLKDATSATKSYESEMARLDKRLASLAKNQLDLLESMEGIDKATASYKKMSEALRGVAQESANVQRHMSLLERMKGPSPAQQAAKGSFTQGFLQGAIPGAGYLQRGPGMFRQAAGAGVGSALRGMAGAAANAPFQGAQGLVSMLQSIPGVGGILAAPLATGLGQGERALSYQRQSTDLGYLGKLSGPRGMSDSAIQKKAWARAMGMPEVPYASASAAFGNDMMSQTSALSGHPMQRKYAMDSLIANNGGAADSIRMKQMSMTLDAREAAANGSIGAMTAARNRGRNSNPIAAAGQTFAGMNKQDAQLFAAEIVQRGGGSMQGLASNNLTNTAFAAKTGFGVGGDVMGSFLQGSRNGGLSQAPKKAGDALTEAIRQGMGMGLEGSEINEYLEQIASGIEEWKRTGIPVSKDSMNDLGTSFASMGFAGSRGIAMTSGLRQGAQGIGVNGPQTGTDLLAMQELGGFKGGGLGEYESAEERMESGNFVEGGLTGLMKKLVSGGGGAGTAGGRMVLKRGMRHLGMGIGTGESRRLDTLLSGGGKDAITQDSIQRMANGATAAGQLDLEGKAKGLVPGSLSRQAGIENQQLDTGMKLLKSMQDMDGATSNIAKAFTALAPEIEKLTGFIRKMTEGRSTAAAALGPVWSQMVGSMMGMPGGLGYGLDSSTPTGGN